MKILLLGNYIGDGQESMQKFASFMARELRDRGHQVELLRPPSVVGKLPKLWERNSRWFGYIDKFGYFPFVLKSAIRRVDVVHICDHSNSFYVKYLDSVANVVTCHDVIGIRGALGEFPENPTRWTGRKLQFLIAKGLAKAQHVACVSTATHRDLLRLIGIRDHRVSLVYNSLNYPYSRMDQTQASARLLELGVDPARPFLLHVGGNQWYKNRMGVLRIFALLRGLSNPFTFRLIMAGKPWTAEMRQFVRDQGLSDVAIELTAVPDEDLRALYSKATLLLFPSLQEGFGWPIVEAQACGCPVATSKRAPMDEVGGDAAIYLDPEDPAAAAASLNIALRELSTSGTAGLQNASRFRTGMIDGYVALYQKVRDEKSALNNFKLGPCHLVRQMKNRKA